MKIEDQVVSLELANRLKELGVKQESLFYWVRHWDGETGCWNIFKKDEDDKVNEHISAFTVAELGEMLPDHSYTFFDSKIGKWLWYSIKYVSLAEDKVANTEADARAKMMIHLIEKGIVKP